MPVEQISPQPNIEVQDEAENITVSPAYQAAYDEAWEAASHGKLEKLNVDPSPTLDAPALDDAKTGDDSEKQPKASEAQPPTAEPSPPAIDLTEQLATIAKQLVSPVPAPEPSATAPAVVPVVAPKDGVPDELDLTEAMKTLPKRVKIGDEVFETAQLIEDYGKEYMIPWLMQGGRQQPVVPPVDHQAIINAAIQKRIDAGELVSVKKMAALETEVQHERMFNTLGAMGHPDARAISQSPEFDAWLNDPKNINARTVAESGDATVENQALVLALYKQARGKTVFDAKASTDTAERTRQTDLHLHSARDTATGRFIGADDPKAAEMAYDEQLKKEYADAAKRRKEAGYY